MDYDPILKNVESYYTSKVITHGLTPQGVDWSSQELLPWYLGQAQLINDNSIDKNLRLEHASIMSDYVIKGLPITRHIFKYVGFIAIK